MNFALLSLALALPADPADSRFIIAPYSALTTADGALPETEQLSLYVRGDAWMELSFVLDLSLDMGGSHGEAYLDYDATLGKIDVVARVDSKESNDLTGLLTVPTSSYPSVGIFHVTIPKAAQQAADLARFEAARSFHYARLAKQNLPGGAWFRHLAKNYKDPADPNADATGDFNDLDQTLDLFTGAQALAENLRLETVLRRGDEGEATIPVDSIAGIETKPFDFKPLLEGKNPALDPLASFIPADQHAVFFPALMGLVEVKDELDRLASPLLELADSRAVDAMTATRIEQQLCLPLSELGRRFGSLVIEQVAITGSDPFYRSGTDVAMLFKAREKGADLVAEYWRTNAKTRGAITEVKDGPLPFEFVRTPDRSTCSYFARQGDMLLVTNSKVQLDAIAATIGGKPSLSSSDDYRFFRDRYGVAGGESALVVIPDAALRRWVSPKYRIADSRRVHALGKLAEERAARVDLVVSGAAKEIAEPLDPIYGSLAFATPLSEVALVKVTQKEADAYGRFRDTYERGFRAYFDPIAIKITATQDQLAFDMTVMPLILGSDFDDMKKVVLGQKLGKTAGHPHPEAVAQLVFAVDSKSEVLHSLGSFMNAGQDSEVTNPLAFVGDWVTFYFDNDPFLDDLAKAKDPQEFVEKELKRLPFAFEVAIKDPLRAGLFMTSLRLMAEQTVPGLLAFDTVEHNGKKYVKVSSDRGSPLSQDMDFAIFYAIDPTRLLVTPNESIVQRALDGKANTSGEHAWQGDSAALHLDNRALALLEAFSGDQYERESRMQTARSLPILNEWKRRFTNEDPALVHERLFHERLVCPGGGKFVYDAERRTMTSTELGDLCKPVTSKVRIPGLVGIESVDLGLTFEHDGVRARAKIER